ncbi:MAG: hypothetical protein F2697_08695, partial [Actinobacteria bacterium]|nr:hypothetical protein [Actinomycetota bacterium]
MAASETSNQPYPGFTIPPGTNTLRLPESPVLTYEPGSGWFFSEGKGLVEGDFIIDDADAFKFVIGDPDAFQTVVKPPNDAPVVIFEES